MAKIPILFQKIKIKEYDNKETIKYLVRISEKSMQWDKSIITDRSELIKLRDEIDKILHESTVSEILLIPEDKALKVEEAYKSDIICKNCSLRMTSNCVTCLFELQSPLERKLFLELKKSYINFQPQYGLNWQGQPISVSDRSYHHPANNFKEVLSVVDFNIEKRDIKLCVYTDGHTYHERTEEQAQRDRNIDRKLQELGFKVLRYTGKDVNENMNKIISDIKSWIEKVYH